MPTLDVCLRLARALGLAPYESILSETPPPGRRGRSHYALSSTHRRASNAALLLIWIVSCLNFFSSRIASRWKGAVQESLTLVAIPILAICRSCLCIALICWQQHPQLLHALNADIFRSLPPLRRVDVALPVLVTATRVCGLTATLSYFSRWVWVNSAVSVPFGLVGFGAVLLYVLVISSNMGIFTFFLSLLAKGVRDVNASLMGMAAAAASGAESDSSAALQWEADAIVGLRRKHKEAVLASEKLCSAMGSAILVDFVGDVWDSTHMAFRLLARQHQPLLDICLLTIHIVKTVVSQAIIMAVAQDLANQANHVTLSSIHAIRNSSHFLKNDVKVELIDFSKQVEEQPLRVSVNGIVKFNLSLFFQAIGLGASYVVVLLQFRQTVG